MKANKCKNCAEWSKIFAEWSKDHAEWSKDHDELSKDHGELSKEYAKWSKWFAEKCMCGEGKMKEIKLHPDLSALLGNFANYDTKQLKIIYLEIEEEIYKRNIFQNLKK